jgi:hypothetical protein
MRERFESLDGLAYVITGLGQDETLNLQISRQEFTVMRADLFARLVSASNTTVQEGTREQARKADSGTTTKGLAGYGPDDQRLRLAGKQSEGPENSADVHSPAAR